MTSYADLTVRGTVENVQNLTQSAFVANGFQVQWMSSTRGKAEKGSRGANVAFGGFAQYYGIDFEIFPAQDASTLRLVKSNTGWVGGLWGASKVDAQFNQVSDLIAGWFHQQGVLQGVRKG